MNQDSLRQHLSYLPSQLPSNPAHQLHSFYVVPREILSQLLASSLRLEKILANPTTYMLDQIDAAIRGVLDNPDLSPEEKNRQYAALISLQGQVKGGLVESGPTGDSAPVGPLVPAGVTDPSPAPGLGGTSAPEDRPLSQNQRNLIANLPADQRERGQELLRQMANYPDTLRFNEAGNLVLNGQALAGSNAADVFSTLLRSTPPSGRANPAGYWRDRLPFGTDQFLSAWSRTPLGTAMFRNNYLADRVQQIRQRPMAGTAQLQAHRYLQREGQERAGAPSPRSFANFQRRYRAIRSRISGNNANAGSSSSSTFQARQNNDSNAIKRRRL